ncbi:MAG TPA: hypothetical protein EYP35_00360 [Desulfobacterales bacterium]|nr:hypothetical protein [Desulfobacterales bacterium]HIP38030.1 hypothetical protein [Desulfocapsa sulfexigens]
MKLKTLPGLALVLLLATCISTYAANRNFISSIKVNGFDDEKQYLRLVKLDTSNAAKIVEELDIGKVTSVELETENGYLVYSVELVKENDNNEIEVLIDPVKGDILLIDEEPSCNKVSAKH